MIVTDDAIKIALFLRRNFAAYRKWEPESMPPWVQWFIDRGLCYVVEKNGTIVGASLVRRIGSAAEAEVHYVDRPESDTVYCEVAVAKEPYALGVMFDLMLKTVGKMDGKLAWCRAKTGRHFVSPMKKAMERLSYGTT